MAFKALFQRLAQSPFRQRFHLGYREYVYSQSKGAAALNEHATAFIAERLAAAEPAHDGKQTPPPPAVVAALKNGMRFLVISR